MNDERTSARRMTWIIGLIAVVLLILAGAAFMGSCREMTDRPHTEAPADSGAPDAPSH